MKISSPIPHICAALAIKFQDEKNMQECINLLEGIETSETETKSPTLDEAFKNFLKELHRKELVYRTAAFASHYMIIMGHNKLAEIFNKLMLENYNHKKISLHHAGYLSGIFTACMMNDLGLNDIIYSDKSMPKNVEEAIKYIESEGFAVYVK